MAITSIHSLSQLHGKRVVIRRVVIRRIRRIMARSVVAMIVIQTRQGRTDQLAIGEILLVARLLSRSRNHSFFHSGAAPAHAIAQFQ
jgi:hypothetical protein